MKAAVIGTGFGASVVAKVYQSIGIEPNVVSPRDYDAVRRACEAKIDLVSVHSPPFLHRDHVLLAIANDHNVLCDKPFGLSAREAEEMDVAARKAGILNFLNFEFRQDSARLTMKQLLDEGAIGSIRHVRWSMYSAAGRNPNIKHNWLFDAAKGGGWIGAYGSHVVDCLRWLVGDIIEASCERRVDIPARPDGNGNLVHCTAEDGFCATFRFACGATASLDTAYSASVTVPQEISIFGSEGLMILNGLTDLAVTRSDGETQHQSFPPLEGDIHEKPFTSWALQMKTALLEGRQIHPSFADGVSCARVLDMLRE